MKKLALLTLLLSVGVVSAAQAQAQWKQVKRFIQKDVEITRETKDYLVLYSAAVGDSIRVRIEKEDNAEIVGKKTIKRGGNPYVVWRAAVSFWNNEVVPKSEWAKFFRSEFLALLRPPEKS